MVWLVLIGVIVLVYLFVQRQKDEHRRYVRGAEGEARVAAFLATLDGKVLNNVLLPLAEGLTQIDHIFITDDCVYVVETKNYNGEVEVSTEDTWRVTYVNGKVFMMYNPVKQNIGHVKAVKALLGVDVKSVVVFCGQSAKVVNHPSVSNVYTLDTFKTAMMGYVKFSAKRLDKNAVYDKLKAADLSGNPASVRVHKAYVKRLAAKRK